MFGFFKDKLKKFLHKASETEKEKAEEKEKTEGRERIEEKAKKEKIEKKEITEHTEQKSGFFSKIKEKFSYKLTEKDFDKIFEELETILIENNVAIEAINFIKSELKGELINREIKKGEIEEKIKTCLADSIEKLFIEPFDLIEKIKQGKKPYVIVFFGINGSGKTTTIAKLTQFLKKNNISCVLAASDTFRAASIEQLEKHANNLEVKLIKQQYGADPAAVAFDAIAYAKSHGISAVLVDTAGRMHTQNNLMKEMEKIVRVAKPDLKIFIGEAITGNDAIEQAKAFNEAVGIDAIILSKADIDEKGGATISVSYITKKPILFLGVGQQYENLKPFNIKEIINNLGL